MGAKETNTFYVYEINDAPDKDISHWNIGDFIFLEEVRFRKNVKGRYIGKVVINKEIENMLSCWYEFYNKDHWDEENVSDKCEKFKNIEDINNYVYNELKKLNV